MSEKLTKLKADIFNIMREMDILVIKYQELASQKDELLKTHDALEASENKN
jgi:hypothetical protein